MTSSFRTPVACTDLHHRLPEAFLRACRRESAVRFWMSSSAPGEYSVALMPEHLVHGLQAWLQAGSALCLRQRLIFQFPERIVALLQGARCESFCRTNDSL